MVLLALTVFMSGVLNCEVYLDKGGKEQGTKVRITCDAQLRDISDGDVLVACPGPKPPSLPMESTYHQDFVKWPPKKKVPVRNPSPSRNGSLHCRSHPRLGRSHRAQQ